MITKFLYQMNIKNKRILTGLVENDVEEPFDFEKEIPMFLEGNVKILENERKVSNIGKLFYGVFKDGRDYKYVNLNDYKLKVKMNATERVAFASMLTKDMLDSILNNTAYLNCEYTINYIDSGFKLRDNFEYDDSFKDMFRKVKDDVYVELIKDKTVRFISVVDNKYDLVSDFKDAMRVYKKDIRNLLVANEYINRRTQRSEISMSHYNIFLGQDSSYLFGGENSFRVNLNENKIEIEKDPKLDESYRLINDELRQGLLRNILYLFKKPKSHVLKFLKIDDLYVEVLEKNKYQLTNIASKATLLPQTEIDILKQIYLLYNSDAKFFEIENKDETVYLYNCSDNTYELSNEKKELQSKFVSKKNADIFLNEFENYDSNNGNFIIISNGSFVKLNYENKILKIDYLKSAFYASKFNSKQIKALERVLSVKYEKRELDPIYNSKKIYNINIEEDKPIEYVYNKFMEEKNNSSIRFSFPSNIDKIKVGSDKGAFEYLEKLMVKSYLDSRYIFNKIIKKEINVLLVGSTVNVELQALSSVCDEKNIDVNVSVLDTLKWGYYPKCYLSKHVKYNGAFRLELSSMTKDVLNYDLIFVGEKYYSKDGLSDFVNNLISENYKGYIVSLSLSKKYGFANNFNDTLNGFLKFKKYFINHDKYEDKNFGDSLLNKDISYYSILKIRNKEILDAIKVKK